MRCRRARARVRRAFSDARVSAAGGQRLGHLHGRVDRRLLQVHAGGVLAAEVQALAPLERTQGACGPDRRAADQRVLEPPLQQDVLRVGAPALGPRLEHVDGRARGRRFLQGAEPGAALASATVDPGVVGRPVAAIAVHVGRVGVDQQARVEVPVLVQQRRDVGEGGQRTQQLASGTRQARSTPRTGTAPAGPPASAGTSRRACDSGPAPACGGAPARSGCGPACAAGCPAGRSSSCTSWRPRRGWPETPARTSAGSTAPTLAARRPAQHPIVAVIHGYRTSSLNDGLHGQAADPGVDGDLPRHVRQHRLPRELREHREVDRVLRRRERVRRREDGRAPGRREDAQARGRLQRGVGVGVLGVVEAELLQQRDVDGVRVGMEELRAEIDGDPPPAVADHPRVAVAADPGSRLEEVDVEAAGQKVGRGHAARTGADDRHAFAPRSPSAAAGGAGRQRRP